MDTSGSSYLFPLFYFSMTKGTFVYFISLLKYSKNPQKILLSFVIHSKK